ncbi:hypothetical protein [Candidatus Palauibacter sp.]|uniref:hypothetical protein n=1 Tax=Candidatus Palauibacter sp. TaxID=3101350 RepID=UPI003AF1F8F0
MRPRDERRLLAATMAGLALAACGGGTTDPPPPPPPPPPPTSTAVTLDLAPGGLVTLVAPDEVRAFRLTGGESPRTYEVIIQSASEAPGQTMEGRVRVRAERAAASVTPARTAQLAPAPGGMNRDLRRRASWFQRERLLRERDVEELVRIGARPVRPDLDVSAALAKASPRLGDTLSFRIGIGANLTVNCRNPTVIRGEVRYAGENFTVVEDIEFGTQPDVDRLSAEEFETIGRQLDEVVYPMNVAYFGEPADIDNNGTVIALITAEVNRLTPAGDESIVAGFFLARDLTSRSSCPASNEGEIFYLVGPDPDEDYGAEISLRFANALTRATVAHEFVHLLNTQQRVTIGGGSLFNDREVAWLDEGTAHLAEEISGLRSSGLGTRANLDLATITASEEQLTHFNHFLLLNFIRFGRFLRGGCPTPDSEGPAAAHALGSAGGEDPGGVASLAFRGFAYGFVRWLGDQFGEAGSGGALPGSREEGLFRELSSGGPAHARGISNVEQAIRTVAGSNLQWEELLPLYLASLIADDHTPEGTDPRTQWRTWNLRGVYGQLNDSNLGDGCPFTRQFPLSPTRVNLHVATNSAVEFTANASTGRFLSLAASGATPDVIVEVMDREGSNLPRRARAQVTILRSR